MSKKRKSYSAEFKVKLVLEVLEGIDTVNEIASKYEVQPLNLRNWKKHFLENMSLAFDKSSVVKEYKEEIEELQKDNDTLARKVGNLTIEKDFLEGKLVSLASSNKRKELIDTKLKISLNKQCALLKVNKSSFYYEPKKPFSTSKEISLLDAINNMALLN
jgi:putative transposase